MGRTLIGLDQGHNQGGNHMFSSSQLTRIPCNTKLRKYLSEDSNDNCRTLQNKTRMITAKHCKTLQKQQNVMRIAVMRIAVVSDHVNHVRVMYNQLI